MRRCDSVFACLGFVCACVVSQVPFRLTRMMVKAMEVAGLEGNFRTTCENVMRVLRTNKESVTAMLEAFVHDPLINWRLLNTADTTTAAAAAANAAGGVAAAVADTHGRGEHGHNDPLLMAAGTLSLVMQANRRVVCCL